MCPAPSARIPLLIELRLLGLDDASYESLRGELLAAAHADGAGASEAALLESIREQGRGVSL